ncbi:MAG: hypothetical protein ABI145_13320 [Steroidobacteraceae bacterium]
MRWLAPHSLALVWVLGGVAAAHAGSEPSTVFVARRGWHIDIGMAVEDLQPPLNQAAAVLPGCAMFFLDSQTNIICWQKITTRRSSCRRSSPGPALC